MHQAPPSTSRDQIRTSPVLPLELERTAEREKQPKTRHLISTAIRELLGRPNLERFPWPSRLDVPLLDIMMEKPERCHLEDAARRGYRREEWELFLERWAQEARDEGTRGKVRRYSEDGA
ncbi:hypothetical protein TRAPUB_2993 [Trametes pubescens]|uniref:Uncharacterized protein n=1 Tax=Trametes pubescens TaxID=154538 RepID=A0A1M2VEY2_TRAPU|nr:hypothetical protein TRAPUB_2993 [Trametes pubescens]